MDGAPNGDGSRDGHSSSRRDDYSSSRHSRDDYRSSRHGDERYESSRYRDRERGSDRGDSHRERDRGEKRHREEDSSSSYHRSSHRESSSRDYPSSSRGGYSSSQTDQVARGGMDYSSSRSQGDSRGQVDGYPGSRDRESRYDSRRGGSNRFDGPSGGGGVFGAGGFGGRGGGAGGYGNRERKRSASPKRPRGPTPDLTNVVPIDVRKRRLTMWDLKPTGYENVTAEQAKMSGLFPLPGAPRNPQQFTPESLKAIAEGKPAPTGPAGSTLLPLDIPKLWALNASNSRQGRRLVVSKLPPSSTGAEIQNFFNNFIAVLNVYKESSGEAVKDVKKATTGGVAMIEFAEAAYATTTLALEDDIEYEGVQLQIRRPANYIVQPPEKELTLSSDTVSKDVPDSTEKIVIKGLPVYLTSEQALELVEAFGTVQGWILVGETDSSESKGVAFTQFKDPSITPIALQSLNGMQLNENHTLSVSLACIGSAQTARATETPGGAMGMVTALASEKGVQPLSRVVVLLNMVTGDDLMDADEYDDILQDVKEECDRFGKVLDLQIPRPLGRSGEGPGVGKVFVRFETAEGCAAALKGLAGRKFSERTVVASYYPEDNYEVSAW